MNDSSRGRVKGVWVGNSAVGVKGGQADDPSLVRDKEVWMDITPVRVNKIG